MPTEFGLIAHYFHSRAHPHLALGIGDDCALVTVPPNMTLAVSTDTYLEGCHFLPNTPAHFIGHKALAINLSDLAAMGADPQFVNLALTLPTVDAAWLHDFCEGFYALADRYHVSLIGGNVTRGPLSITCTVQGFVPLQDALRRDGARVHDRIYITGPTGLARLGRAYLQQEIAGSASDVALRAYHTPDPCVDWGITLRKHAHACIDISDGLIADLTHILDASNKGARIDCHHLPLSPLLSAGISHTQALHYALAGGDDYQLCFTSEEIIEDAICIGEITTHPGVVLYDHDRVLSIDTTGYQHF